MSLVAMPAPDRRPSPPNATLRPSSDESLKNNRLSTNNPFRRASPPAGDQPTPVRRLTPPNSGKERPMSRNPFLDPPAGGTTMVKTEQDVAAVKLADDIFRDQPAPASRARPGPGAPRNGPPHHRSSRSGDARDSHPRRPHPDGDKLIAISPEKQRQRRNSESSLMDKDKADADRRRRERRREREARREKEGKDGKEGKEGADGKDSKSRSKPTRRPQGFDVIDKLDLTGIYGSGMIHHDGPFDACNPHRNKKHNNRAPMQAFHPNSANMALGGNAPQTFDYDRFHGRGTEGFADYASSGQEYTTDRRPQKHLQDKVAEYINPTDRGAQIHGEESHGLGTSTFLEGAPASRAAQARRESENDMQPMNNPGGLGRSKSLAMRIRGLSQPRRPGEARANRPEGGYGPRLSPNPPTSQTQSAGGPTRARPMEQERNPFFENNHDDAYEKKGVRIELTDARSTAPTLTRAITTDSAPPSAAIAFQRKDQSPGVSPGGSFDRKDQPGGGFISRMKSLKGGRRPRPEIRS